MIEGLVKLPGLQSPNAVEGLVKLLRRMTSNVYPSFVTTRLEVTRLVWEEFVLKPEALRKRVATRLPCGAKKFQLQVFVHAANVMKHP